MLAAYSLEAVYRRAEVVVQLPVRNQTMFGRWCFVGAAVVIAYRSAIAPTVRLKHCMLRKCVWSVVPHKGV